MHIFCHKSVPVRRWPNISWFWGNMVPLCIMHDVYQPQEQFSYVNIVDRSITNNTFMGHHEIVHDKKIKSVIKTLGEEYLVRQLFEDWHIREQLWNSK